MSDKICIFAGTTEGRKLASLLAGATDVTVCVATEYGQIMLDGIEGITIHSGRMSADEMPPILMPRLQLIISQLRHLEQEYNS